MVSRSSGLVAIALPLFFFNAPAPTRIYTLSLHDALPIYEGKSIVDVEPREFEETWRVNTLGPFQFELDRKSTRLNSSHVAISYAVFCLKKKKSQDRVQHSILYLTLLEVPQVPV